MTPGRELKALNGTNNSGLWLTRMNLGYVLKALDAMNNLELWMK